MTDQESLQAFATDKSEEAFRQIVERYSQMVYSVCFRVLNNSADAQDVTQVVFTCLAEKANRLSKEVILSGWLYRTALLKAQNQRRKSQSRSHREEEIQKMMKENSISNQDSPWETVRIHLDQAIGQLPSKLQTAVVLHFLEGKTQKETAQLLGCDEDAVRMRLSRSVEKLRAVFSHRGVTISAVAFSTYLGTNRVEAVPSSLNEVVLKTVMKASSKGFATAGVAGAITNFIISSISPKVALTVAAFIVGFCAVELAKYESKTTSAPSIRSIDANPDSKMSPNPKIVTKLQMGSSHTLSLKENFYQFLAKLKKHSWKSDNEEEEAIHQLIQDFVHEDPDLAIVLFQKEIPRSYLNWFFTEFFGQMTQMDLQKAVQLFEKMPSGDYKEECLQEIVRVWAKQNPMEAVQWVQSQPSKDVNSAYGALAEGWATLDPKAAEKWALGLASNQGREKALEGLAAGWAKVNLEEAKAWVENLSPNDASTSVLSSFASAWAETDLLSALEWGKQYQDKNHSAVVQNTIDGYYLNYYHHHSSERVVQNWQGVLNFVHTLTSSWDDQTKTLIFWKLYQRWSEDNPQECLSFALQLPPSKERDQGIRSYFSSPMKSDSDALDRIQQIQLLPSGDLRNQLIKSLANTFRSTNRESHAQSLLSLLPPNDPETSSEMGKNLARNYLDKQSLQQTLNWTLQLPSGQREGALGEIISSNFQKSLYTFNPEDAAVLLKYLEINKNSFLPEFLEKTKDSIQREITDRLVDNLRHGGIPEVMQQLQPLQLDDEKKSAYLNETFGRLRDENDITLALATARQITDTKEAALVWPNLVHEAVGHGLEQTAIDWVSKLPSGIAKDQTINFLLCDNNGSIKSESYTFWINSIETDSIRAEAAETLFAIMWDQDRSKAMNWLNQQNVPQKNKDEMIQHRQRIDQMKAARK